MNELQTVVQDCGNEPILQGALIGAFEGSNNNHNCNVENTPTEHRSTVIRHFEPNKNLDKQWCFFQQRKGESVKAAALNPRKKR